ncbi:hypothetical protein, partial [Pseudomonas syringae]
CLFLLSYLSVDRTLQAFIFNVYRDSKVCVHVGMRGLDNRLEPVDKIATCPQGDLSSGLHPAYPPS